jgi:N12 class adenine-specific DNA methylase
MNIPRVIEPSKTDFPSLFTYQPTVNTPPPEVSRGDKTKARDILAAIRTLKALDEAKRPATWDERQILLRFPGFGPVALGIFPDPVTGLYPDASWQQLGGELQALLTPEDYASAKRTTFTAFYTSPLVIRAMYEALRHLGVPQGSTVLEPGCGIGNFIALAPEGMRFIGVELDSLSGRMARALHPTHNIRIENFRDTRLPEDRIDAVIGNVPFADLKVEYAGVRLSLHDFFLAKSLDALKPGGVLALVTTHYTLDKQHAGLREQIASQADFLGAIRLPSTAFAKEGTRVVTDILCLRKRTAGEGVTHTDPAWLETAPLAIEGIDIPINRYFLRYPEMVLGTWSRQDRLYASEAGYSLLANGDLAVQLQIAVGRLPEGVSTCTKQPERSTAAEKPQPSPVPLPPLEPHITEGSFFIDNDKTILQVQQSEGVPVTHGDKALRADSTGLMGKRLAGLITLRDHARRVLQSQNEGWSEAHRQQARILLNRVYDRFVAAFGPINKTTSATTEDGTTIRRMPNLVKFKDDPDAMLVMSLEHYDEETGSATKAAIMHQDVVGRLTPITTVQSAEAGLLVCLDHRGGVDLPYIATLYKKGVREIIAELGDLIYQDPDTGAWQTADAYLSGNVRAKLAAAEVAGAAYTRNAEALRAVQPEDVLPGDIDAHLGAPWIPEPDIQAFAASLFGVSPETVQIAHLKKDAVWSVEPGLDAVRSVAATTDYGTERANGVWLLEQALNLKTPVIYDTVVSDGKEERVLNQEETLAAREKQKQIKEQFKGWLFTDPDRTDRLVRLYNDIYNNLRLRAFDGSHLAFPGMSQAITLQPHQKAAVWRVMSSGNTLLAHAVGAGKTYEMAAAGMKMKQAGLLTKPLYIVPNHMLEQFGREFMQLYPNARLLIAGKEDFTRDRRKLLTAKMASGTWDGIIVTHSSFERIGMSRDYQERFLREQITEYDQLLCDSAAVDTSRAHRNIIKTIEKQKAKREERLKHLLAAEKKDDGLVFDELGVDHIFIDESHYFKNLETPTKMERVAGIQTSGSERAFDLYMKARFLHRERPGRGVTFATGTPISNTMVEMYTIQRYLDPDGLVERGIDHFDAWAATFGEVVDTMEISPDGKSLRPRSRFAKFSNLPELQQMFRAFADVQTAQMLNLPRPRLKGEKATVIACPMSEAQYAIQESLVSRYEAIRSGKVKPWEDNALAITTDGRKLALDARLISPHAEDFSGSKINALIENVCAIWQDTMSARGTQLIFSDMGVNPTAWGYSVYGEIIDKLVKAGILRQDIATIGDADTDAKKQVLFEKVRAGAIRVLLGSTQKMGTGTNVQKRLVVLHHLDAPWKPAEVEQRDGRILRQGNGNVEVAIYRYVTEGSFDAYMWQALETKARFIAQVMTGACTLRHAEDIGGQELSYAEVKAIASGNPAVLTLAEADAELQRLAVLKKHHADEQFLARRKLRELPGDITRLERRRDALAQDMTTTTEHARDLILISERRYNREDAPDALALRLKTLPALVPQTHTVPLGVARGLTFGLVLHPQGAPEVYVAGALTRYVQLSRDFHGSRAVLNAVERLIGSAATEHEKTARDLGIAQGQLRDYEARLGAGFAHAGYLNELTGLRNQLEAALSSNTQQVSDTPVSVVDEIVTRIKTLKAAHTLEATPARTAPRPQATVEEAITTRIRQRAQVEPPPQMETTPLPVSPATPAPLPPNAPESPTSLLPIKSERRSLATPPQPRRRRPTPRFAPRQLSLLPSADVQQSATASSPDRPELWQPPRQLSLL